MTKSFIITALLLFLVSCNGNQTCPETQGESSTANAACPVPPDPTPEVPQEDPGPVPQEADLFDANLKFVNFDVTSEAKVHKAVEIIKKVIASDEFKSKVINFTYQGKKTYLDNLGLTNAQIYQKILDAKETLHPEVDHEMDMELELYYSSRNVVGYTYPNSIRIWMNTKYFNVYSPSEVAGNVFHEWTHKLGFDHASSYSVSRDSSVPYALGYIMRDLGKQYE